MTTALATRNELSVSTWGMIQQIAPVIQKSRLFGVATIEQAASIMLKGHELGFGLTASFEFIHIIGEKPALTPRGALALVQQSPDFAGMKIEDLRDDKGNPTGCKVWMKRKNGMEYTVTFTMEDARNALLTKDAKTPGMWEKYPANMARWRAIGYCIDVIFPDITGGMKRTDELGADLTPDGNIITVEARPVIIAPTQPVQPQPPQVNTATLLNDLVADFGPMAILAANDNKLPATVEEVEQLRVKLENSVQP